MTMAKAKGIGADLSGWNAMTWARHWKQRVGVELTRGRERLIRAHMRTVESGEADDQGTTHYISSTQILDAIKKPDIDTASTTNVEKYLPPTGKLGETVCIDRVDGGAVDGLPSSPRDPRQPRGRAGGA